MIFKLFMLLMTAFFIYVELEILGSDNLSNGEKFSSTVCFVVVELFFLLSFFL